MIAKVAVAAVLAGLVLARGPAACNPPPLPPDPPPATHHVTTTDTVLAGPQTP